METVVLNPDHNGALGVLRLPMRDGNIATMRLMDRGLGFLDYL